MNNSLLTPDFFIGNTQESFQWCGDIESTNYYEVIQENKNFTLCLQQFEIFSKWKYVYSEKHYFSNISDIHKDD